MIHKIRRPLCGAVMTLCIILLLGITGTVETGGDIVAYTIQGSILLIITIIAGIVGKIFD